MIAFARMDGVPLSSIAVATNKARTAARAGKPTADIGKRIRDPEQGFDIAYYGDPRFCANMPGISDTIGWIYLKKSRSADAVRVYEDLIDQHPNRSTFHYHPGMAYAQTGEKEKALAELNQALTLDPSSRERQEIETAIAGLKRQL